jgi:Protein of unknown function (DUF3014)
MVICADEVCEYGEVTMADLPEYELLKTPDELTYRAPPRRPVGVWIAVAVLVVAIAAAAYIVFVRRPSPATTVVREPVDRARPVQPLGGDAMAITLPPLDDSDGMVRELVKQLSSHPRVAAWLATDDLIRNFTVVVVNVADGSTPAGHLQVLRPSSRFRIVERRGDVRIDPRSYDRFDAVADAAASLDPAGSARLYATLKPRIEEAHRELGFDTPFDRTLERSIVQLLQTPVLDSQPRVEPKGIGYRFVDPAVEGLTGAQKQLLRTGPRNVRMIQTALRNIALALGIPADRLPTEPPH